MEVVHEKGWFARNWLWVVPVGGCLTVILIFVFGIGAIIFGASKAIKNATPYAYAMEQAQNHPEVIAILGKPIETDGIFNGEISLKNDRGTVDLSIPIRGPEGRATIIVRGEKYDGEWTYDELYVRIKSTKERINLLDKVLGRVNTILKHPL